MQVCYTTKLALYQKPDPTCLLMHKRYVDTAVSCFHLLLRIEHYLNLPKLSLNTLESTSWK